MGPNQSRTPSLYGAAASGAIPGMPAAYESPTTGSKAQAQGYGIMGAIRNFFPTTNQGDVGGSGPVDMTVTGEGCQPITDLGWKKKENKYLGQGSLSDREVKELKEMNKRLAIEQFNYKFPENEKHLGLENVRRINSLLVSFFFSILANSYFEYRNQMFATSTLRCKSFIIVDHLGSKF